MKLAICSLEGSVGKTTIGVHLLYPRLAPTKFYTVDTTNVTAAHFGLPTESASGDEFSKLYKQIVRNDNFIIDVGGSKEGAEFLSGMEWVDGQDEIDYFVVPAKPENKAQAGALKTIQLLISQGVAKDRIKVIFNMVKKNTVEEFDYLLGGLVAHQVPFSLDASIFANELYDVLSAQGRSLDSMLHDSTDYKQIMRNSDDEEEISRASDLMIAKKGAPRLNENMETVFQALFPPKKAEKSAAKAKE